MADEILATLIAWIDEQGIAPEELDEIVHDLKGEEAAAINNALDDDVDFDEAHDQKDAEAAAINNGGIPAQAAYILDCCGGDLERAQRTIAGE